MDDVDGHWMRLALEEAGKAFEADEGPVGDCIVQDGRLIGKGHNLIEELKDPTAHAEIIAIGAAAGTLSSRYLDNSVI